MEATEGLVSQKPVSQPRYSCRACAAARLDLVLDLGEQYLPRFPKQQDLSLPRAPLRLHRCTECGLLQLGDTVDPDLLFREYWYRSSVNQTMREALRAVVHEGTLYHRFGKWVDIGANDGYLLSQVPPRFDKVGCEPARNLSETAREHCQTLVADYFSADYSDFHDASVITSAAMFYDLEDPVEFAKDVARCLKSDGVWINQLNDSPTMIRQNAFDSVCHEHLTYYDLVSLERIYRKAGLRITRVSHNDVNGGSVRVTARKASMNCLSADLRDYSQPTLEELQSFAWRVRKWKHLMWELLEGLDGTIWAYGASTKGTVLLQYLGDVTRIVAVADRNPAKHGLWMAGSWLPITDEEIMRMAGPEYLLVLPWAFRQEFVERERKLRAGTAERFGSTMIFPLPNVELVV